jgi:hypothetical protein
MDKNFPALAASLQSLVAPEDLSSALTHVWSVLQREAQKSASRHTQLKPLRVEGRQSESEASRLGGTYYNAEVSFPKFLMAGIMFPFKLSELQKTVQQALKPYTSQTWEFNPKVAEEVEKLFSAVFTQEFSGLKAMPLALEAKLEGWLYDSGLVDIEMELEDEDDEDDLPAPEVTFRFFPVETTVDAKTDANRIALSVLVASTVC